MRSHSVLLFLFAIAIASTWTARAQDPVVARWDVFERSYTATGQYDNPFVDQQAVAVFTSPGGVEHEVPLFYDGDDVWKVRFAPDETGTWTYVVRSTPADTGIQETGGRLVVVAAAPGNHGFLRTTPGQFWDFQFADGTPVFLLGDTMYNLFGAAASGEDYQKMLLMRKARGFNLFRARLHVSAFHPPRANNVWQRRDLWPWGGTREDPDFFRLDLDWFRHVDEVVAFCQDQDLGLEMIFEAWGFEFPFNNREVFNDEVEAFWIRYIVARYGAYRSVYYWTLLNEYEFYPDGEWAYTPEADPWAEQLTRKVKAWDVHDHPVAVHNGPQEPLFKDRFGPDTPIDLFAFQTWGTTGEDDAWLSAGIDEAISRQREGLGRALLLSEYGYERTRDIPITFNGFRWLYEGHLRRGAWRGAFSAVSVIAGFQMTWAPFFSFHETLGLQQIEHLARFIRTRIPFHSMRPAHERVDLIDGGGEFKGLKALCLLGDDTGAVAVYLPVGGTVRIELPFDPPGGTWIWYDPVTGAESTAEVRTQDDAIVASSPPDEADRPQDWVLYLNQAAEGL